MPVNYYDIFIVSSEILINFFISCHFLSQTAHVPANLFLDDSFGTKIPVYAFQS